MTLLAIVAFVLSITRQDVHDAIWFGDPCEGSHTPVVNAIVRTYRIPRHDVYQEDGLVGIGDDVFFLPSSEMENLWQLCYGSGQYRTRDMFLTNDRRNLY